MAANCRSSHVRMHGDAWGGCLGQQSFALGGALMVKPCSNSAGERWTYDPVDVILENAFHGVLSAPTAWYSPSPTGTELRGASTNESWESPPPGAASRTSTNRSRYRAPPASASSTFRSPRTACRAANAARFRSARAATPPARSMPSAGPASGRSPTRSRLETLWRAIPASAWSKSSPCRCAVPKSRLRRRHALAGPRAVSRPGAQVL